MRTHLLLITSLLTRYFNILFTDLSQCQLTQLPDAVFLLMKNVTLNSFNISGNLIQKIPAKLPVNFCLIRGESSCQKYEKVNSLKSCFKLIQSLISPITGSRCFLGR